MTRVVFLLLVLMWTWQREAQRSAEAPQASKPAPLDAGTRTTAPELDDASPGGGDDRLAGKKVHSSHAVQEPPPEPHP